MRFQVVKFVVPDQFLVRKLAAKSSLALLNFPFIGGSASVRESLSSMGEASRANSTSDSAACERGEQFVTAAAAATSENRGQRWPESGGANSDSFLVGRIQAPVSQCATASHARVLPIPMLAGIHAMNASVLQI